MAGGCVLVTMYFAGQPNSNFIYMFWEYALGNAVIMWNALLEPTFFPENLGRFGIAYCAVAAYVLGRQDGLKRLLSPAFLLLMAAAFVGYYARLKYGSGPTQAIVFNAMLLAFGLSQLSILHRAGKLAGEVLVALLVVQSLALVQDLRPYFLGAEDRYRFDQVLSYLRTPNKSVYYANQGFTHLLVGKQPIRRVEGPTATFVNGRQDRSRYDKELADFFGKDPFDIVIIDVPLEMSSWFLYDRLNAAYQPIAEIPADSRWPQGGTLRFKKVIFQRKSAAAGLGPRAQPSVLPEGR